MSRSDERRVSSQWHRKIARQSAVWFWFETGEPFRRWTQLAGGRMTTAAKTLSRESGPVLVQSPSFDLERVRRDFPILNQSVRGKALVYLDNAATSQKPQ